MTVTWKNFYKSWQKHLEVSANLPPKD